MTEFIETAKAAARKAGEIQIAAQNKSVPVSEKAPQDLVTEVDIRCGKVISEYILDRYPEHAILSEELGETGDSTHRWIVDPLDGTTNFVHGISHYSVSIALEVAGELKHGVVYAVEEDTMYAGTLGDDLYVDGERVSLSETESLDSAVIGIDFGHHAVDETTFKPYLEIEKRAQSFRRLGSAAIQMAYVAEGRLDGVFARGLRAWDIAAGTVLVRAAGGVVTDLSGNSSPEPGVIATNDSLHGDLLSLPGKG